MSIYEHLENGFKLITKDYNITVLGGMQPYFFPYLGYFSLIKATNKWIVFDIPQYVKGSWINRNRVIKFNSIGWKLITVPVKKHNLNTPINKIEIQNSFDWKEKLISQLDYYKKFAPYYHKIVEFLHEYIKVEFDSLADLNLYTLKALCDYIGIELSYEVFSEMDIKIEPVEEPDEWALNICKAMGITEYINAEQGQLFIERNKYQNSNINIRFLEFKYPQYDQKKEGFVSGLSIIDAMMFNSPAEIYQMLDEYRLIN